MTILKIDTEQVYETGLRMSLWSGEIFDLARSVMMAMSLTLTEWEGSGKEEWQKNADKLLDHMGALSEEINSIGVTLQQHAQKWELVDGDGTAALREVVSIRGGFLRSNAWLDAAMGVFGGRLYSGQSSAHAAVFAGALAGALGTLSFSAIGAGYDADVVAGFSGGKLLAEARLRAETYLGKFEYDANFGALQITADGFAGAEADGHGSFVFDPTIGSLVAAGSISAFIGGRVSADSSFDIGVARGEGHFGARAGLGLDASGDIALKDGKLAVDWNLGVALGIGADIGFSMEFDLAGAVNSISNAGTDAIDFVGDVAGDIVGGVEKVAEKLKFW